MRFILWFFAVIGFVVVLLLGLGIWAAFHFKPAQVTIAETSVLRLDLLNPVTEAPRNDSFDRFFSPRTTAFASLLAGLRRAGDDPKIKGLVARTGGGGSLGYAQVEELRAAIAEFRAKGKFAYAFADSYGDLGGGTRPYFLASAFDQIWLQPGGDVGLVGLALETPFFKGSLDKLGVVAEFERRGEFKTAATEFTDTKLPDTDRKALDEMLDSLYDQIVVGIAESRKLTPEAVRSLIDEGPYGTQAALDKHLIDKIGHFDEFEAAAKAKAGTGASFVDLGKYLSVHETLPQTPRLALIHAAGEIVDGGNPDDPFGDGGKVYAEPLVRALHQAAEDSGVAAIVLRIDSPGGSEIASETIWRAVALAKAKKPLIVSMGDYAASGGYFIAAPATTIVADPATLTGSIGVFGGRFVVAGLSDKLGVTWDSVSRGENARIESPVATFSPAQHARFAGLIDEAYKLFISHVAEGRNMKPEAVDAIARGRVWTGAQAKERGLVDELGGLQTAIAIAKKAAHLDPDKPVAIQSLPAARSPFNRIVSELSDADGDSQSRILTRRLEALTPWLDRLEQTESRLRGGTMMEPVEIRD